MAARSATDSAKQDGVRLKLNLKNLRRHDESITEIVESTSYVVMYSMTKDGSWAKTNIEGPMFLFKRSVQPFYGFFVLNRQGLEYVQEDLAPDSMVELMGDFIAVEPAGTERIHGIWCYEPEARESMCRKMEELRALSVMSPTLRPRLIPYNQSIPIDMLFASPIPAAAILPSSQSQPHSNAAAPPRQQGRTGMMLLDSIFASVPQVVAAPPPPPPSAPKAPLDARSLLAMIGHPSGHPAPPAPHHQPNQTRPVAHAAPTPTQQPSIPAPPTATRNAPTATPALPIPAVLVPIIKSIFAPPLISHSLFADHPLPIRKPAPPVVAQVVAVAPPMAAVVSSSGGAGGGTGGARGIGAVVAAKHIGIKTLPRESTTPGLDSGFTSDASVKVNGTPKKAGAKEGGAGGLDKLSTMNLLDGAIAQAKVGMENGRAEPLDKGEFVRSVLALVYTTEFSESLYASYLERTAAK